MDGWSKEPLMEGASLRALGRRTSRMENGEGRSRPCRSLCKFSCWPLSLCVLTSLLTSLRIVSKHLESYRTRTCVQTPSYTSRRQVTQHSFGCLTNSAYNSSGKSRTSKTVMAMIVLDSKGGKLGPSNFIGLLFPRHTRRVATSVCALAQQGRDDGEEMGGGGEERGPTKENP